MDGLALQKSRQTQTDEIHHLAKVRVAGSNPVFRSKKLHTKEGRRPRSGRKPDRERGGRPTREADEAAEQLEKGNYGEVAEVGGPTGIRPGLPPVGMGDLWLYGRRLVPSWIGHVQVVGGTDG